METGIGKEIEAETRTGTETEINVEQPEGKIKGMDMEIGAETIKRIGIEQK